MHEYNYRDILNSLAAIPKSRFIWAIWLTALGYLVMIGYDILGFSYINRSLNWNKIALTSFISSAFSNTIGLCFAEAHGGRGISRYQLGDKKGAIADYTQALRINPNLAPPYASRGIARFELGDKKGGIADFNQALRLNPDLAPAYTGRGIARYTLGDKQGAIADLQKAANLSLEQGKTDDYQQLLELIKKLQS